MGFFGKGSLSRSKPEFEVKANISQTAFSNSKRLRRLPPKEREIRQSKFRVLRKERFKNHQQWFRQATCELMDTDENCDIGSNELGESYGQAKQTDDEAHHGNSAELHSSDKIMSTSIKGNEECGTDKEDSQSSDDDSCQEGGNTVDSEEEIRSQRLVDEIVVDVLTKGEGKSTVTESCRDQEELEKDAKEGTQAKEKRASKRQEDPYKVYEHLQLSLEEAFFLSYGLGCLCVRDKEKKPMSLDEMWCHFCAAKQNFAPSYITYHYFRSKGWIPKAGIKYGTDFVLYKEGMPFYHSSYSVIIQMVDSQMLEDENESNSTSYRRTTWSQMCGVSRVNEQTAKEVMISYVIKPPGMTQEEIASSPKCIPNCKVQEVVLRRWIPERARDPDKEES